jgi:hypothetical protein
VAWTTAESNSAFLVLDRNGNGVIDDARELFGNYTLQPTPPVGSGKNGFLALAVFDTAEKGGNGDGQISALDAVYEQLRLWIDRDHNGRSSGDELISLSSAGISDIDLGYKESCRVDDHGNQFRYRTRVARMRGSDVARWAWDVLLKSVALPQ